jgi:hypothetical protein
MKGVLHYNQFIRICTILWDLGKKGLPMKVPLQITLLVITIMLAACTTAPLSPVESETPTPTQIVPTSTLTPTLAPTPTATPLPVYKAGITPEMEYEDCNQLHEDTLTAELTELVAKEHAWLDAQGVTADMITGHGMGAVVQLPLSPYQSASFPPNSDYLTSCSVLHMKNGTDMFLLGIVVKNNTSDNIAVLHFGIDDTGMAFMAKDWHIYAAQNQNYTNSRTFFGRIKKYTKPEEF